MIKKSYDYDLLEQIVNRFCKELDVSEEIRLIVIANIPLRDNYIIFVKEKVAGAIGCLDKDGILLIEYIYVYPEYRNKNIGGLLGRFAWRKAKLGIRIVVNPKRIRTYKKLGFSPVLYIMERLK